MTRLTPEQEYAINDSLSEVFYKYRLDSAIRYGERNLELARRLGDRERCASAAIRLARFYSSRGACIEARQLLDSIRRELPPGFLELYYRTYIFFYDCYGVFSGSSRPTNNRAVYRDSLRRHLGIPANTSETREQAEQRLLNQLTQIPPGTPDYAKIANSLGSHYRANGDDWLAKKYYTLSAIADIQNATKENDAILQKSTSSGTKRESLGSLLDQTIANRHKYRPSKTPFAELRHLLSEFRIVRMTDRLFASIKSSASLPGQRPAGRVAGQNQGLSFNPPATTLDGHPEAKRSFRRSVPRDMLATYYKAYSSTSFRELEER